MCNQWPFKVKLSTDNLRWDSLKIQPCAEFEEHIVLSLNEAGRRALAAWIPVKVVVFDVDTGETYEVKLVKKELFWFEPLPLPYDHKMVVGKPYSCSPVGTCKARQEFAYSIEPFRRIKRKRGLKWDQEIALRCSGNESVNRFDFSVVCVPSPWDLRSIRI